MSCFSCEFYQDAQKEERFISALSNVMPCSQIMPHETFVNKAYGDMWPQADAWFKSHILFWYVATMKHNSPVKLKFNIVCKIKDQ